MVAFDNQLALGEAMDKSIVFWFIWTRSIYWCRPVKNWVVGCWHGYVSGVMCRFAYGPADATDTHFSCSIKSRLVLPFWYRLTWVVPDEVQRP